MNTSAVQMSHATVVVAIEFEKFISTFESLLGKYDPIVGAQIRNDPQLADHLFQAMEGEQNLMIFWRLNHGALFSLIGQSCNAMRYTIGNPRIALQMTRHDVLAALYVPFNILVIENDGGSVRVEYDLPCVTAAPGPKPVTWHAEMTAYKQPFAGRDKENSPPHWRESREKVTSYARLYLNNSDGLMNVSAHWAGTKRAAVFKVS